MASAILILLLSAAVNGAEYFVRKNNSDSGLCISNERQRLRKDILPIYDLSSRDRLPEGETSWYDEWRFENMTVLQSPSAGFLELDHKIIMADGSSRYELLRADHEVKWPFFTLAANASFVLSNDQNWQGRESFRVHLDNVDSIKNSTAVICQRIGTKREHCQELEVLEDETNGEAVLLQGSKWVKLEFTWDKDSLSLERDGDLLLRWRRTKFFSSKRWRLWTIRHIFVRTHQQPGLFRTEAIAKVEPDFHSDGNRLSRTFEGAAKCLLIRWGSFWDGDNGRFLVLDDQGREVQDGRLVAQDQWETTLEIDAGSGSEFFRLDLLDLTETIHHIGVCPGKDLEIFGPARGCSIVEGDPPRPIRTLIEDEFNPNLSVNLSVKQLEMVCAALGYKHQEEVKFCSWWGHTLMQCHQPSTSNSDFKMPAHNNSFISFE